MTYTANIPKTGETLGSTRSRINTNFQEIANVMAVNHVAFNSLGEGKHTFVEMQSRGAIPPSLTATDGTFYVKSPTNVARGETTPQVFYSNGNSGNEYQITGSSAIDYATFGSNTTYASVGNFTAEGGWTFLAGRNSSGCLLFQYGKITKAAAGGTETVTIPFPKPFTFNPFSLTASIRISGGTAAVYGVPSPTGFPVTLSEGRVLYWLAIGV